MKRSFALLAGLLFICTPLSRGAIVVWTNSVGGNWSAATNWSPNQVPSTADHAVITNAGTYTVIVDAGVTVDALTVGGASGHQTLSNFVATLTLNGNGAVGTNASFALNGGGVFAGTGELTVAGRFDWRGGIMQGAGRTVIGRVLGSGGGSGAGASPGRAAGESARMPDTSKIGAGSSSPAIARYTPSIRPPAPR